MVSPISGSSGSQPIQPIEDSQQAQKLTQEQVLDQIEEVTKLLGSVQSQMDQLSEQMQAGTLPPGEANQQLQNIYQNFANQIPGR